MILLIAGTTNLQAHVLPIRESKGGVVADFVIIVTRVVCFSTSVYEFSGHLREQ